MCLNGSKLIKPPSVPNWNQREHFKVWINDVIHDQIVLLWWKMEKNNMRTTHPMGMMINTFQLSKFSKMMSLKIGRN